MGSCSGRATKVAVKMPNIEATQHYSLSKKAKIKKQLEQEAENRRLIYSLKDKKAPTLSIGNSTIYTRRFGKQRLKFA
jgi:hypothetical protein